MVVMQIKQKLSEGAGPKVLRYSLWLLRFWDEQFTLLGWRKNKILDSR